MRPERYAEWVRRAVLVVVIGVIGGACMSDPAPPPISRVGPETPATTVGSTTTITLPSTTEPTVTPPTRATDDRQAERSEMVDQQIAARAITDLDVLGAMASVPRHRFVPDEWIEEAYDDHPLPIGHGQTISQPYIVALMSQALDVEPGDKVLEIGTGSGYQAAILAAMGLEVFTIEIIPELATLAAETLGELGYAASVRTGDGYFGWEEEAPFDAIIVTAAPDHVPQPLIEQLDRDSVLVIPVGPIGAVQTLWRFRVDEAGDILAESLAAVSFVPFTRSDQ